MNRPLTACLAALLCASTAGAYQTGDHELLTMPTAWTMDKGQSYFTDYELVCLNYNYGITPRTHIGVFTLFPVTAEMLRSLTLGMKQNWLQGEKVSSALWLTYSPDFQGLTVGNVFSFGTPANGFHAGACLVKGLENNSDFEDDGNTGPEEYVFMAGYRKDLGPRLSGLLEYYTSSSILDDGFNGLGNFGLRWRGENLAVDFGGMRPLSDTGDLLFIPYLKATVMFGGKE